MRQYYYGLLIFLSLLMTTYLQTQPTDPRSKNIKPNYNRRLPIWFPPDKLARLQRNHKMNDKNYQLAITYLAKTKWQNLVSKIMTTKEYSKFRNWLLKYKINIDDLVASMLNYDKIQFSLEGIPAKIDSSETGLKRGSFKSFIEDVLMEYKIDTISKIILEGHGCTRGLVKIKAIVVKEIGENNVIDNLLNLKDMQNVTRIFRNVDINIKHYFDMLYPILIGYKLSEK